MHDKEEGYRYVAMELMPVTLKADIANSDDKLKAIALRGQEMLDCLEWLH